MTSRQPPRLATWLLQRLGHGRRVESLIGDLSEEYMAGKSARWYWRQTLVAIANGFAGAARKHAPSLALALAAGWVVIFAWRELNALFIHVSHDFYVVVRDLFRSSEFLADLAYGWDKRRGTMVFVWLVGASIRVLLFAISGWVVARMHPANPRVAMFALIATVLAWHFPWLQLRIIATDYQYLIHYGTAIAGILLGGLMTGVTQSKLKNIEPA